MLSQESSTKEKEAADEIADTRLPLPGVRSKKKKLFTNPTAPFLQIPEEEEKKISKRLEETGRVQDEKQENRFEEKKQEKTKEKKQEKTTEKNQEKNEKKNEKKKEIDQKNKRSLKTYSFSEDKAILDYIVTKSVYRLTKGDMIWKHMEEQGLCPSRSWRGMKKRFLGSLVPNLALYGLSKELLLASDRKTGEKPAVFKPVNMREQKEMKMYSQEEDMLIIMYIIKNQRFKNVMGPKLWKLMEERQVVMDRSWGSMMSRFKTFILKNINQYSLEESDLEKFKAVQK